jgi:hypothetical protein
MKEKTALINADELPTDVASGEALLARHQQHKVRSNGFPSRIKKGRRSFIGDPGVCPMDGYEHPLLYLSGTGRASRETALSGSYQQNLAGICNTVWVWWLFMG